MNRQISLVTLGSLCIAAATFAQTAQPIASFPSFRLFGSKSPDPDREVPARLCLVSEPRVCFTLPIDGKGDDALPYFWRPTAKRHTALSGESFVLFSAIFPGGSGSSSEYALLRFNNHKLTNLLPRIILSNQSNIALWDVPTTSDMPVLVTAEFIWEDGAHYEPHRATISAYRYESNAGRYIRILTYDTHHIFPGYDNFDHSYPVLEYERKTILAKLAQLPSHK